MAEPQAVASLTGVSLRYGRVRALDEIDLELPAGGIVGLIGPDGVGKSSLLALIAGARQLQSGSVQVLGGDMSNARHRREVCPRIAFMPQGLGRNLYPTLSVQENIDFFGRLFGLGATERQQRIDSLTQATGLRPFLQRPAGKLSGGMKQKLGLCCALIHDPQLLILDEPTTGVDPLSRRQFWQLIESIRQQRPGMTVLVATSYMEEAAQFDWLVALHAGRILDSGTASQFLQKTHTDSLEQAFLTLMQPDQPLGHRAQIERGSLSEEVAIEAHELTMCFGEFTAVDRASFRIHKGEIFGFVGSNGCGKTTTMKMLTGLLPPTSGEAWLFGQKIEPHDLATRQRVGYMSQFFSLYSELSVRQNLELHAQLFQVPESKRETRIAELLQRFDLEACAAQLPDRLPLGHRQRLSLAVALIHEPELLILDEPTSGVDPLAREDFWRLLLELSHRDGVTIFVSTHFMNEATYCDRIALMHAGTVLVTDTPEHLVAERGAANLEEAFISYLEQASGQSNDVTQSGSTPAVGPIQTIESHTSAPRRFSPQRLASYAWRETLELRRDPIRLTLALVGSLLLMIVMGYGISMDVEDLSFAVLDRDQSSVSHNYVQSLAGSRYFIEHLPLQDYASMDARMRSGELSLALEIPPGFAEDLARGRHVQIGAWVDGAMPNRAETVNGYLQAMHQQWLQEKARAAGYEHLLQAPVKLETRFRYNPDVKSLMAMVPAVIPLLLMLIPAMLTALSVVREKELGSITNFYVTPTSPLEFLLGKQLPYIALSLLSFVLLTLFAVFGFGVPITGSLTALCVAALLYIAAATGLGLTISSFIRSQTAVVFATAILTLLPAINFSGLINPVSSLEGFGRLLGELYPTTYFVTICRGTFSKALGFSDLSGSFWPLLLASPLLLMLSALLLKKQER